MIKAILTSVCCLLILSSFSQNAPLGSKKENVKEVGVNLANYKDGSVMEFSRIAELDHKENVISISIQSKGLTEVPMELSQFRNLKTIDLSHNNIESITPGFFSQFSQLERLYFNNNKIPVATLQLLEKNYPKISIIYLPEHFH